MSLIGSVFRSSLLLIGSNKPLIRSGMPLVGSGIPFLGIGMSLGILCAFNWKYFALSVEVNMPLIESAMSFS